MSNRQSLLFRCISKGFEANGENSGLCGWRVGKSPGDTGCDARVLG